MELRRDDFEAFDRAQHADRGRDHPVPVEHRRAEDAEADEPPASSRIIFKTAGNERGKRQNPALAPVVGAHDQRYVFERHDDHQRPENRRQHAEDVFVRERERVRAGECGTERVERARADVAVNDADRADHERRHALLAGPRCNGGVHVWRKAPRPVRLWWCPRRAAKSECSVA